MPGIPGIRKFFGRTVSEGAAFAFGLAVGPALHPEVQNLVNEAWKLHPSRPLDAGTAAGIVAEGVELTDWGTKEAEQTGISADRFAALLGEALNAPGLGELFAAWRRDLIDDAAFTHGLRKAKLEPRWDKALRAMKLLPLDTADLARGIHRGLVPDPGLLQGELPAREGNIPAYPIYPIDALAEAAAAGMDRDHLGVLVGLQGNPMGAHEAAEATFRGVLTHDDYLRAIAEGNTRNEWAEAIFEQTRQIPTARDFFENALRGYHDFDWALEQAKRHGMSEDDATVIYQNQGRPMNVHQITQALARGGVFKPEPGELTDPYEASIVEGSIKPAYYDLERSLRYSYPSPAYFRLLQTSGVLTPAQAEQRYLEIGWEPTLAKQVATALGKQRTGAAKEATATDLLGLLDGDRATEAETLAALRDLGYDEADAQRKVDLLYARRVTSAKAATVSALHADYKKGKIDATSARHALEALGIPEWAAVQMIAAWAQYFAAVAESNVGGPDDA